MRVLAAGLALLLCSTAANATIVTFNNFDDTSGLTLVGNTTTTGSPKVLRLVPAATFQSGAAYSTTAITLGSGATFSTQFKFRFTEAGGINPADGITFVLAKAPSGLGVSGFGMGYQGVANSIAIEFDTYNNTGFGLGNDDGNSSNHVSIDTSGVLTNTALANVYGIQNCNFGAGYTQNGCMSNGHDWIATILYDGTTKLLNVTLQDPLEGSVFNALTDYNIDIASLLGTNDAYVGFTASTGSGWENEDIVNWTFSTSARLPPPPTGSPEPVTLSLFGAGLALVGMQRRRAKKKA